MAEPLTIRVPDMEDAGLTNEGKEQLVLFLQNLKDQYNVAINDLELRIQALE